MSLITINCAESNPRIGMIITENTSPISKDWIAIFQGYDCTPTSEGISRATTRSVVYSSLVILGLDFVLTTMMMKGW